MGGFGGCSSDAKIGGEGMGWEGDLDVAVEIGRGMVAGGGKCSWG